MKADDRPLFAANWKMFKTPDETRAFVHEFSERYRPSEDRRVAFFPPAIDLPAFVDAAAARPDLGAGAQDVHAEAEGAHTGAISARMVAATGATWCLAGHSERRREFGDDDATVARKVGRILSVGLQPVVCVGETLEEREDGRLEAILSRQARAVLTALAATDHARLTWAYEPVWAIGTGRTASPEDAAEAHAILRASIADEAGADVADRMTILYGGSVKPGNIGELMAAQGIDGVLVGGASLEPQSFAEICSVPLPPG